MLPKRYTDPGKQRQTWLGLSTEHTHELWLWAMHFVLGTFSWAYTELFATALCMPAITKVQSTGVDDENHDLKCLWDVSHIFTTKEKRSHFIIAVFEQFFWHFGLFLNGKIFNYFWVDRHADREITLWDGHLLKSELLIQLERYSPDKHHCHEGTQQHIGNRLLCVQPINIVSCVISQN